MEMKNWDGILVCVYFVCSKDPSEKKNGNKHCFSYVEGQTISYSSHID